MVTYGRLKSKENFKRLALKEVTVANERCSLKRGFKYSGLTCHGNFCYFGKLAAEERW